MTSRKVMSAMKLRYHNVTGHGRHSGVTVSRDEDVSALDSLALKLFYCSRRYNG